MTHYVLVHGAWGGHHTWGEVPQQHWQRRPTRPEGLQVDLWLAAAPGAPSGTWPLRLRFEALRSGDVFADRAKLVEAVRRACRQRMRAAREELEQATDLYQSLSQGAA